MKIVITGGTFAGKTSLVKLFKKDGFKNVQDIGLETIKELNTKIGITKQREFRINKPIEFYSKIIKKQLKIEKDTKNKIVVFDRGILDYIAMLKLTGLNMPESLINQIKNTHYDLVFICDTLSNFKERKNTGRSLNKNESLKLNKLIKREYSQIGCKIVTVKEMPLKERFEFIKNKIN
jgi:predicted ATPase